MFEPVDENDVDIGIKRHTGEKDDNIGTQVRQVGLFRSCKSIAVVCHSLLQDCRRHYQAVRSDLLRGQDSGRIAVSLLYMALSHLFPKVSDA
jgi:hypothetical protein